jgi:ferredoxin
MKVIVDKDKCTGHARCNAVAPEVYPLDHDGYNALTEGEVPAGQEQHARDGAAACPERAIAVTE